MAVYIQASLLDLGGAACSQPASRRTSTCGPPVRPSPPGDLGAAAPLGRTASQPSLPAATLSLSQNRFSSQLDIWEVSQTNLKYTVPKELVEMP
jgi:hypothetical protein